MFFKYPTDYDSNFSTCHCCCWEFLLLRISRIVVRIVDFIRCWFCWLNDFVTSHQLFWYDVGMMLVWCYDVVMLWCYDVGMMLWYDVGMMLVFWYDVAKIKLTYLLLPRYNYLMFCKYGCALCVAFSQCADFRGNCSPR